MDVLPLLGLPLLGTLIGGVLAFLTQWRLDELRAEREREATECEARASARVWRDDIYEAREWIREARRSGTWPPKPQIVGNEDDFRRLAASDALKPFHGGSWGRAASGRRAVLRAHALSDQAFDGSYDWDKLLARLDDGLKVLRERFGDAEVADAERP